MVVSGFLHLLTNEETGEQSLITDLGDGETWQLVASMDRVGLVQFSNTTRPAQLADREMLEIADIEQIRGFMISRCGLRSSGARAGDWVRRIRQQPGLSNRGRDHFHHAVEVLF